MTGIHDQVKQKATHGVVYLDQLKPNAREVAKRMIAQGELVRSRDGRGYILNQVAA